MAARSTLPNQAATGFADASNYDKFRPSYPAAAVEKLLTHLNVAGQKDARIVDLASGTGKFTEVLVARPENFEVIAVEPHQGMREILVKKNLGPRLKVLDGDAGHMPVEAEWGDALVTAQAWHWFATEESLGEIHRVLRPGSAFGMIWNIEDYNGPKSSKATTKWEQQLKDIIARLYDGHPRFRDMVWKEAFEKQQDSTPIQALKDTFTHHMPQFSLPLGEEELRWTVWLTDDAVWQRYTTLSQVANLDAAKKEEVKTQLSSALKGDDVERNEKGEVGLHGVTYMAWTSRV